MGRSSDPDQQTNMKLLPTRAMEHLPRLRMKGTEPQRRWRRLPHPRSWTTPILHLRNLLLRRRLTAMALLMKSSLVMTRWTLLPATMLMTSVPGVPGEDYPIYAEVPESAFTCEGQVEG